MHSLRLRLFFAEIFCNDLWLMKKKGMGVDLSASGFRINEKTFAYNNNQTLTLASRHDIPDITQTVIP